MAIVCPHCATTYRMDADKLGDGRSVRCVRCKEVWFAMPEPQLAMAGEIEWTEAAAPREPRAFEPPPLEDIESPPLAAELPDGLDGRAADSIVALPSETFVDVTPREPSQVRRRMQGRHKRGLVVGLPTLVAAMAALIGALAVWRGDVVKLLPQTALLYKTIGLEVNLRGLSFRDVKLGSETVDGKSVIVIEGVIVDELKRPLEIPKIRFVVRDAKGNAIYAWTANADQAVIEPGQRVAFRSRLAAPPDDAQAIDVRFFHKLDLAASAA